MKTLEAKPFDQYAENWKRENRLFTSTVHEAGASWQNQIGTHALRSHRTVWFVFAAQTLFFLVRNWHCWSRKAFTRQMTPQIREKTAKTAVFRQRWQAWKVVRSIAAVRQRPRTPRNWWCSFAFFESFLWHFNKKQHAEVIFRLSRPVLCKNQENGSGKQWSLHAPLKGFSIHILIIFWSMAGLSLLKLVFTNQEKSQFTKISRFNTVILEISVSD